MYGNSPYAEDEHYYIIDVIPWDTTKVLLATTNMVLGMSKVCYRKSEKLITIGIKSISLK